MRTTPTGKQRGKGSSATTKVRYANGTWYLVPLPTGGYARGIVVRHSKRHIAFGYFFGPKLPEPVADVPADLIADAKVLWGRFSDGGLVKGEWPIIEYASDWSEEAWPMPPCVRVDESAGVAFMTLYDEGTLKFVSEQKCDPRLVDSHPPDGLMGYGAVEIRLGKILAES